MILVRLASYVLSVLVLLVALVKDRPFSVALYAVGLALVVAVLVHVLPGPTPGWRSPSGALSFRGRPTPGWAVLVSQIASLVLLGGELYLLASAWGT